MHFIYYIVFYLDFFLFLTEGVIGKQCCSVCKKVLSGTSSLKVHMRIHDPDRPFKCNQCKKGYITEYDYKRHLSKHSGEIYFFT